MADQLRETESGTEGVRRILCKQVGRALKALKGNGRPLSDEAVHDARKQLKRTRAALRLLRKELGSATYRRENTCLRDAARPLTEVRDAKVLADTLDNLAEHFPGQVDERALAGLRRALLAHQGEVCRRVLEEGDTLGPVREALAAARERTAAWPLRRRGWSVLGAGLKRVYRNGRDAFAAARQDPSVENLHEWRKQDKYLWHQLQVLRPIWPDVLDELADQAHTLADYLGDDHDLAVLRQKLHGEPERFPDQAAVDALGVLIARRRAELQEQARDLGGRLYEEKPRAFADRLEACWRAWRSEARAAR
jgi:CHAD domain-containing protein